MPHKISFLVNIISILLLCSVEGNSNRLGMTYRCVIKTFFNSSTLKTSTYDHKNIRISKNTNRTHCSNNKRNNDKCIQVASLFHSIYMTQFLQRWRLCSSTLSLSLSLYRLLCSAWCRHTSGGISQNNALLWIWIQDVCPQRVLVEHHSEAESLCASAVDNAVYAEAK